MQGGFLGSASGLALGVAVVSLSLGRVDLNGGGGFQMILCLSNLSSDRSDHSYFPCAIAVRKAMCVALINANS